MPKRAEQQHSPPSAPRTATSADAAATSRYAERWAERFVPDYFRVTKTGLTVSSVAFGTYLGDSDDETDAQYEDALRRALVGGVNIVDTAINYRCQRSERVIGRVLQELMGDGLIRRDEVVLCTKAGYVPLDGSPPASREDYASYVRREYLDSGVLKSEELVGGGHSIAPAFLLDQLQRSMRNLGVQAIDCFYIHNPEQQLAAISPGELRMRLRKAFAALESCVANGKIGCYGCATWSGLRLPDGSPGHLSLFDLAAIAREVGGEAHHFRIAQAPINLTMSEAVRVSTQRDARGRLIHLVDAARETGVDLVASAPLLQGKLTQDLPEQVRDIFPGSTDAQRALAFVRGLPGVVSVAVGTKTTAHLDENLAPLRRN